MIQSQLLQQVHRHLSPTTRSRYIAWTLLKVHSQHFSGGPCRESGFPLIPCYEACLYKNAQQEEWLVAVVISVPDERYGSRMEYYKHFDDVHRRTSDAGTSEAAKRTLYYIYHAYRDEL
jgi:hypothetical protein